MTDASKTLPQIQMRARAMHRALCAIARFIEETGERPTIRDIAEDLGSTPHTTKSHLYAAFVWGLIEWSPLRATRGRPRVVWLTERGAASVARSQEERTGPTSRQRFVLNLIATLLDEHGYAPTLREISLGMGFASERSANSLVIGLRAGGYVDWKDGLPRTMRITELGRKELARDLGVHGAVASEEALPTHAA